MIISIISPDKLSITMCISYLKVVYGQNLTMACLNYLMSPEEISTKINQVVEPKLLNSDINGLLTYYTRKVKDKDPKSYLPAGLESVSDLIVWIDLYSTAWVILKDAQNQGQALMDRWTRNIEKFNSI